MTENLKSGHEIVQDFFASDHKEESIDSEMVKLLQSLFKEDKLTNVNLANELLQLRKEQLSDNSKED